MSPGRSSIAAETNAAEATTRPVRLRRRRIVQALVISAALALSGWVGWAAKAGSLPDHARVVQTFHGTVDFVDGGGGSGCFFPDSGARQCGGIYRSPDQAALQHGEKVNVAVLTLDQGDAASIQVMVVYPNG